MGWEEDLMQLEKGTSRRGGDNLDLSSNGWPAPSDPQARHVWDNAIQFVNWNAPRSADLKGERTPRVGRE